MRIDAGFVVGDDISSHYDPMIAKLIVKGPTRETAIFKLRTALEQYEIAGPITNIEFLKRVCQNSAFLMGDVETGFINKHRSELFCELQITPEVYAQAALGSILREAALGHPGKESSDKTSVGFTSGFQNRILHFSSAKANGGVGEDCVVEVKQINMNTFNVLVNDASYPAVRSTWVDESQVLTSFFPHTRLETRLIVSESKIIIFQQGKEYRLQYGTPKWFEKALGIKDVTNSVLAPMPCKILRVEVEEGETVRKDQALVVIESMKMETVIRSPHDGVISRIVHQQGVSVYTRRCQCY